LQAEVADYIDRFSGDVDENGHRLVVRNGYHQERDVVTSSGAISVTAPRVNDKRVDPQTVERQRYSSKILPAWVRGRVDVPQRQTHRTTHRHHTGSATEPERFDRNGGRLKFTHPQVLTISPVRRDWFQTGRRPLYPRITDPDTHTVYRCHASSGLVGLRYGYCSRGDMADRWSVC
jgi:hypothetical protein